MMCSTEPEKRSLWVSAKRVLLRLGGKARPEPRAGGRRGPSAHVCPDSLWEMLLVRSTELWQDPRAGPPASGQRSACGIVLMEVWAAFQVSGPGWLWGTKHLWGEGEWVLVAELGLYRVSQEGPSLQQDLGRTFPSI